MNLNFRKSTKLTHGFHASFTTTVRSTTSSGMVGTKDYYTSQPGSLVSLSKSADADSIKSKTWLYAFVNNLFYCTIEASAIVLGSLLLGTFIVEKPDTMLNFTWLALFSWSVYKIVSGILLYQTKLESIYTYEPVYSIDSMEEQVRKVETYRKVNSGEKYQLSAKQIEMNQVNGILKIILGVCTSVPTFLLLIFYMQS